MLENKATMTPEDAASIFFHGISMEQFIIAGSWSIEFLTSLKGSFNLIYCMLMGLVGLVIRKYNERKVFYTMKQY